MVKLYSFCVIFLYLVVDIHTDLEKPYGDFRIILKKFEFCKGPKYKNCTECTSRRDNETSVAIDLIVKENIIPTKGKVVATSAISSDAIRLLFNKPCDNLFLNPILKALVNVNNKCEISKGSYKFSLNFEDMMEKYYGGKYFYGSWQFRSLFYNNNCNFICTLSEIHFIPR